MTPASRRALRMPSEVPAPVSA
ncbi:MAG: hypothetical protein K0Q60_1503, partial [Microvirga sp.]|nr:hypothetical protein [Microvirga sp.]